MFRNTSPVHIVPVLRLSSCVVRLQYLLSKVYFFEYYRGHILFSVYSSCHVGEVPLSVHESAVELLLLAHKLIAVVRTTSEAMRSILVRHLYQDLEGVKQDDVQRLTKVQVITMH